jgi:1-deoxy-D-xylulose-5-phosphate reductoisomerase
VVIANKLQYNNVKTALADYPVKVFAGEKAIAQLMESESFDIVFNALRGISGLESTMAALKNKKTVALANKELMVVAGHLLTRLAHEQQLSIFPVDSEHSAILQCLAGEHYNRIEKIYLTASGGPFRGKKEAFLKHVTSEEALKHPNWNMGNKISIDSATLMNKGLEVIEAHWFFNLDPNQIDVVIHPQSVIHSIVQFEDGSMKAQMGLPDMRLPIQYALNYPIRIKSDFKRLTFQDYPILDFELPDLDSFPCLRLAYEALKMGGNMPCVLNAANEVAVQAFLDGRISFTRIPEIIEDSMNKTNCTENPDYEQIIHTHAITKEMASGLIDQVQ